MRTSLYECLAVHFEEVVFEELSTLKNEAATAVAALEGQLLRFAGPALTKGVEG